MLRFSNDNKGKANSCEARYEYTVNNEELEGYGSIFAIGYGASIQEAKEDLKKVLITLIEEME